jgi:hypothetical protein
MTYNMNFHVLNLLQKEEEEEINAKSISLCMRLDLLHVIL